MFGIITFAPHFKASSLPLGCIVPMAVVAGMLESGMRSLVRAIIFRHVVRSPLFSFPSGVSGWGMKGPMPTMSASSSRVKIRSIASSLGPCPGSPTIHPAPTSYPSLLRIRSFSLLVSRSPSGWSLP